MTENKRELTTLHAIRFQVDSIDETLAFYKKLGCVIEKVESSNYSISVYLKFTVYDSTMIHLFKDFRKEEKLTEIEKQPTMELAANKKSDNYHEEIFGVIAWNGIKYSNVDNPQEIICVVGQFADQNNCNWELVDQETQLRTIELFN